MKFNIQKVFFKIFLKIYRNFYLHKHKKWGGKYLDKSIFFLSFDFETQKDVDVIDQLTEKLLTLNILPYYAIPGQLIENNKNLFKKISRKIIFINHGYKIHTKYSKEYNNNFSSFSYSEINNNDISKDIINGHNAIINYCNRTPKIFRVPHFGSFSENSSLSHIYHTLKELNYLISSSTTPIYSILKSPIFIDNGIYEIPSSAYIKNPLQIIDSWSMNQSKLEFNDLNKELIRAKELLASNNLFFNIYFDPSDIIDNNIIFERFSELSKFQTRIENLRLVL